MRIRFSFVAALATLAVGLVGVAGAAAAATTSNGSPTPTAVAPLYTVKNVVGVSKNGSKFHGTYGIQRFQVATLHGKKGVYSVGTLKGTFRGHRVTRYGVMMPASLKQASAKATDARVAPRQAATACSVLNLNLGPINLNLLGLNVAVGAGPLGPNQPATNPIAINIYATPAGGLLGQLLSGLLCNSSSPLAGLLGSLQSSLTQLEGVLNGLLAGLGSGALL